MLGRKGSGFSDLSMAGMLVLWEMEEGSLAFAIEIQERTPLSCLLGKGCEVNLYAMIVQLLFQ